MLFRSKILGTKYKIIAGYPAQDPIGLAMERGEVQGSGSWSWSSIPHGRAHWLTEKKIHLLFQLGLEKHPELPDVPLPTEFARTEEDREILRLLMGMKKFGYPGHVWPVNPSRTEVAGLKCYPNLAALPSPADLAILSVNSKLVTPVIRDCVKHGIFYGVVFAGGFGEGGDVTRDPFKIGFHLRRVRPRIKIGEVPFRQRSAGGGCRGLGGSGGNGRGEAHGKHPVLVGGRRTQWRASVGAS